MPHQKALRREVDRDSLRRNHAMEDKSVDSGPVQQLDKRFRPRVSGLKDLELTAEGNGDENGSKHSSGR